MAARFLRHASGGPITTYKAILIKLLLKMTNMSIKNKMHKNCTIVPIFLYINCTIYSILIQKNMRYKLYHITKRFLKIKFNAFENVAMSGQKQFSRSNCSRQISSFFS